MDISVVLGLMVLSILASVALFVGLVNLVVGAANRPTDKIDLDLQDFGSDYGRHK